MIHLHVILKKVKWLLKAENKDRETDHKGAWGMFQTKENILHLDYSNIYVSAYTCQKVPKYTLKIGKFVYIITKLILEEKSNQTSR